MKTMIKLAGPLLIGLVTLGCSTTEADTRGTEGGTCYANKTCNQGLYCLSMKCVSLPEAGLPVDAGPPKPDGVKKNKGDGGKGKGGDGGKGKPDGGIGKPDGRLRDGPAPGTDMTSADAKGGRK